jgi:Ca2+/Na+ antiporter
MNDASWRIVANSYAIGANVARTAAHDPEPSLALAASDGRFPLISVVAIALGTSEPDFTFTAIAVRAVLSQRWQLSSGSRRGSLDALGRPYDLSLSMPSRIERRSNATS